MSEVKSIAIRLPNWLGDMVMATSMVKAVRQSFPDAKIDFIVKKELSFLMDFFPVEGNTIIFDKSIHKGIRGVWKFGRDLQSSYDIFFCLPDSFSSAVMARASGAKKTIGYRNEMRSFLLTHAYSKPKGLHRVEEYLQLLAFFLSSSLSNHTVELAVPENALRSNKYQQPYWVINVNSEASSRRLPLQKAISVIDAIRRSTTDKLLLVGSKKESEFINEVYSNLKDRSGIEVTAGKTSIGELICIIKLAKLMVTTDSGPAHVANALGTPLLVLFGAGNENNTGPFNKEKSATMRLNKLKCEPCLKNKCPLYPLPECMLQLNEVEIVENALQRLNSNLCK